MTMQLKNLMIGLLVLLLTSCSSAQSNTNDNLESLEQNKTLQFKAHNGIRFEYSLLLPPDYNRANDYKIVALLCEVSNGDNAWLGTMKKLETINLKETILIVPKVPLGKESWGTHPIHHGFNDLLKSVRKSHGKPNQKFHLIGLEAGHETAFWWTYGSANLIASTSIINGHLWKEDRWDKRWYNNLSGSKVPIYAYEEVVIDKFDMSKFQFLQKATIGEVINDIETR